MMLDVTIKKNTKVVSVRILPVIVASSNKKNKMDPLTQALEETT